MSSAIINTTAKDVAQLQQRTKELFSEEVMQGSAFAKELYKKVRN